MTQIKVDLKAIIMQTMIPQVEDYLEDLNDIVKKNKSNNDDLESIRDLESFLVELQNVVLAIDEDKMNDNEASDIYQRILLLIEESNNQNI